MKPDRDHQAGFLERFATGLRAGWRETVGAEVTSIERGSVSVELMAGDRHRQEGGVVQGGIIAQVADASMAMSLMTLQPLEETNTTVELKINFVRPVIEGRIKAVGRVVEMKKSVFFAEADVYDDQGRLVARASSTCMAVPSARE